MTDLHTAALQRYELSVLPSADQALIAQNFAINELQKFTKKNVTRDAQFRVNKIAELSLFYGIFVFFTGF